MKKHLILFSCFLLLAAIALTSWVSLQQGRALNRQASEYYLESAAGFVRRELNMGQDVVSVSQQLAAIFNNPDFEVRLTVISLEGDVLYDNETNKDTLDNHFARPEVQRVILNRKKATETRYSKNLAVDMLYLAVWNADKQEIIRVSFPLAAEKQALAGFRTRILIIAAAALLLTLLLTALGIRKITSPLSQLNESTRNLASGDLDSRVDPDQKTYPEIKELTASFNHMALQIQEKQNALSESEAWLNAIFDALKEPLVVVNQEMDIVFANHFALHLFEREINPQKNPFPLVLLTHEPQLDELCRQVLRQGKTIRQEYTLQTANVRSAFQVVISPINTTACVVLFHDMTPEMETRKLRSEFVANVSHELKTPLTSIRGFVETLRSGKTDDPQKIERFLQIIDQEAKRLAHLIDDIMALSDLEREDSVAELERFDLTELIDESLVQLDEMASRKKIALITDEIPYFLPVRANRGQIKQIILNLLDNAIKYNRPNGHVWVHARRDLDGLIKLTVRDDGTGIPPADLDRIFERFYRADKSRSRELGGTGLGLSIVKHIARHYEGEISVVSDERETVFTVRLRI